MKLSKRFTQIVAVLFCLLIVVSFSSCNSTYWYRYIPSTNDLYANIRPDAFPESTWVCNDPQIILWVDENHDMLGEIIIENETRILEFKIVQAAKIMVYLRDNDKLSFCLEGTCDFKTDSFSVEIDKDDKDTLFHGQYDKIVFIKQ